MLVVEQLLQQHLYSRVALFQVSFFIAQCQAKFLTSAKILTFFVSYFASQSKGIKFSEDFFDVCICVV